MTKNEILEKLKRNCKNTSIILPEQLDMSTNDNSLIINMSSEVILKNMQTDPAAFESWAVLLIRWISEIKNVVIKWEEPISHFITDSRKQHYQRFLFRVLRFCDAYLWANIEEDNMGCLNQFVISTKGKYILNAPSKERSRTFKEVKPLKEYSESQLEEFILSHKETKENFKNSFALDNIDNQLPVGVFKDKISNSTKVFTGGKSAIDIWGINKQNEFCLFELKNSKNRKVGVLSEMLFYAFIIKDVQNGIIEIDSSNKNLGKILKAQKVICYLLTPLTHPLIDKEVFRILNNTRSGIHFGNVKISKTGNKMEFMHV